MTWQTPLTRAKSTSLCTSAYYLGHYYLFIFWASDFSGRMILCAYDWCAYDLSGTMMFSERMISVPIIFLYVWFVFVWLFSAYDFHDNAPVPVGHCKNSNKCTIDSGFLNFSLLQHRIVRPTRRFTWGCARVIGQQWVWKWSLSAQYNMDSHDYMGHFPINRWRSVINYTIHCWLDIFSANLGPHDYLAESKNAFSITQSNAMSV